MLTFTKKSGRRTRMTRMAIESHWDDFTQRVEAMLVTSQLVSRATPDGFEKRFMRRTLA